MRGDRGSVLMLLPAAVLVFLVLGALCVDYGSVYAARRELIDAAAAAANDVAARAVDLDVLYETGEVRLDLAVAEEVARRSIAAKRLDRLDALVEGVDVDGVEVTVRVRGRAQYLFAKAVPGGPEGIDLVVRGTAASAQQ